MRRRTARLQTWWTRAFVACVLVGVLTDAPLVVWGPLAAVALALAAVRPPRSGLDPVDLRCPVRGRWEALNSPGSQVPSHGLRAYGQEYAVDVRHPPADGASSGSRRRLAVRPPEDFGCFGEPVHAVADGVVVRATDALRDQRSRDTVPALLWMMTVEGFWRELAGVGRILGNHVVLDHGDGTFSAYAHLRHRSLQVAVGDRVTAGDALAEVGSTGNTTEPHLHFQLMDDVSPTAAAGVPWRWTDVELDGGRRPRRRATAMAGLPADGQVFRTS